MTRYDCSQFLVLLGLAALAGSPVIGRADSVGDTRFSVDRGYYDTNNLDIVISSGTPGAYIRYTTDGSTPSTAGGQPAPVTVSITRSTPLRALAYDPAGVLAPSDVDTQTYVLLPAPMVWNGTSYTEGSAYPPGVVTSLKALPSLFIAMAPGDFETVRDSGTGSIGSSGSNEQYERPCSAELFYPPDNPEFGGFGGFQVNAGLRPHSWVATKRAFRLYFKREYGMGKLRYPVFESAPWGSESAVEVFDKLVLRQHSNDGWEGPWSPAETALYLRDQFARLCQLDMSGLGGRSIWTHLFVNGAYYGLYSPCERPDDDFQASYLGGSDDDYLGFNHGGVINDGADTDIYDAAYDPPDLSLPANYDAYREVMDVTQFSDYLIESWFNLTHSHDWPVNGSAPQNYYGGNRNIPPGPVRHFTWDFEASLVWPAEVHEKFQRGSADADKVFIKSWFALTESPDFMTLFADRVYRHLFNDGALTASPSTRRLQALANHVRPAIEAEDWQWGDPYGQWEAQLATALGRLQSNQADLLESLRDEAYYPYIDPPLLRHAANEIAVTRLEVEPPYLLELVNPNGTTGDIRYTLDGSDPRAPGGAVAAGALDGGDAVGVSIAETTVVKARVHNAGSWSALHELSLLAPRDFSGLKFTEIMYHPIDEPLATNVTVSGITGDAGGADFGRAVVHLAAAPDQAFTEGDRLTIRNAASPGNNGVFTVDHVEDADVYLTQALSDETGGSAAADLAFDGDRYAFVEIKNTGSTELDLSGVAFSHGVTFAFPDGFRLGAGAFAVVANRPWNFRERYPAIAPDGEFLGALDNAGERLEIAYVPPSATAVEALATDSNGIGRVSFSTFPNGLSAGDRLRISGADRVCNNGLYRILGLEGSDVLLDADFAIEGPGAMARAYRVITSVSYDDRAPWPMPADGYGYSAVSAVANPDSDQNDPAAWRASAAIHGSPGADDPFPGGRPALRVTEALTHTDWPQVDAVEIHNPSAASVDLDGWWLTDDRETPRKFALPATNLAAGAYAVFREDNDGDPTNNASLPPPYFGSAFSLSSHGEQIYLFAPDLGYSHGHAFDAAANGIAFGVHVTSEAEEHFIPRVSVTLGTTNSPPRVGPVIFTEIHYHPADADHEFVELKNIAPTNVALFNAEGLPWRVNGLGFSFPPGVTLVPGEVVLLVRDTTTAAAFRSTHGISESTRIWEFDGKLDNGSETLSLLQPDLLDVDATPWIPLDRVKYRDSSPWPTQADGGGYTLERISEGDYGNDPVNWRASLLTGGTPGQAEPPTTPLIALNPSGFVLTVQEEDSPAPRSFEIWNAGIDTLSYTLATTSTWITAIHASGVSTGNVDRQSHSLEFNTTNLPAGEHIGVVVVTDGGAANSPVHLTVRLSVTERDRTAPLVREVVPEGDAVLRVVFNEAVTPATAEDTGSYSVDNGVTVNSAGLAVDGRTVALGTTSRVPGQWYALSIEGVEDLSGNPIAPGTSVLFEQPDILVPEGLLAYWPLREGSGTTSEDVSGGGHVLQRATATWTADGRFDHGFEFDGQTTTYASGGSWSPAGTALTVCAWFKADDFGVGDARIVSKATDHFEDDHYFMLSTITDNGMVLRARLKTAGSTSTLIAGSGSFSAGEWVHAAMVYDGVTLKLYKDGVEVGSQAKSGSLDQNDGVDIWVGNNAGPHPKPFDGVIDEIRIYGRALTSEELQTLHNATAPSLPTVQVTAVGNSLPEDGGAGGAAFRITRSSFLGDPLTISVATEGTATGGEDYAALPDEVVIPAGHTAVDLPLVPIADTDPEWNESVLLRLLAGPGYQLAQADTALLTIIDDDGELGWAVTNRPYRLPLLATAGSCAYTNSFVEADIDLSALLTAVGPERPVDTNSFLLVETDSAGSVVDLKVVFQFDPSAGFHSSTQAAGRLVWLAPGALSPGASRYFHLYFSEDSDGGFSPPAFGLRVQLTDSVTHEGQESYRIVTSNAVWYYHKAGGGFASIEDGGGNDWISYHPTGNEQGNYRGIPNLAAMHPGQDLCLTQLLHDGPLKLTFRTTTTDGQWSADWEVYPDDRVRFTLTRSADTYWVLYEGTPGGQVDGAADTCLRSDGTVTPLNQSWNGDLAATNGSEWACFRDGIQERTFFVAQHEDDGIVDTYWPMGGDAGMTVFGIGRESGSTETFLSAVPRSFSFGLLPTRNAGQLARRVCAAVHPVNVATGPLEIEGDVDGDGMSDGWEIAWFGRTDAANGGPLDDWDADGFRNRDEELAGTLPTDAASRLVISDIHAVSPDRLRIAWQSVPGLHYRLMSTTNLHEGFSEVLGEDLQAEGPVCVHTNHDSHGVRRYYRIELR